MNTLDITAKFYLFLRFLIFSLSIETQKRKSKRKELKLCQVYYIAQNLQKSISFSKPNALIIERIFLKAQKLKRFYKTENCNGRLRIVL